MALSIDDRIAQLVPLQQSPLAVDTMAEAGRKVLLAEFVRMLKHEAGSRTGEDIEDVHDMRVAIRRMRSTFSLLKPYFPAKDVRDYNQELRRIASTLGDVRDLDVLIQDLGEYQASLPKARKNAFAAKIAAFDQTRESARAELVAVLDGKRYRRFLKSFAKFLTTPIEAAPLDGTVIPIQVRHVLPGLIYERLASVLAYDDVLDMTDEDDTMLHALRIEFKRLRYAVSLFEGVLGSQIGDFISELKIIQDCLGGLQDAVTARARLETFLEDDDAFGLLSAYVAARESRAAELKEQFPALWERFKTRKVQQKLSNAVLALR
jgi:CHAD domain-containing protein